MPRRSGSIRAPICEQDRPDVSELATLGFLEVLAQDTRPTLVLDLTLINDSLQLPIVYRNPALCSHFALNEFISGRVIGHSDLDYIKFRDWIVHEAESNHQQIRPSLRSFAGGSWIAYTVRSKFRIVSGVLEDVVEQEFDANPTSLPPATPELFPQPPRPKDDDGDDGDNASLASTERCAFGCTDLSVPERAFTPFVQFFRSVDWSSTSLGKIDDWPLQLHQMVNFVMHDPTPAFVLWGKELSVIYNEAAIQVLLDRHPQVMGLPLQEVYPEVWDQISILIHKVQKTGRAVRVEDVPMLLNRRGRMDECFFSFQYLPITDERGVCLGVYESFNDVTRQNHAARRMSLLLAISTCSSVARDIADFWRLLLEALDTSEALPFVMIYTAQDQLRTDASKISNSAPANSVHGRSFVLEGQLGIPEGHITHVTKLCLSPDAKGYGSAMYKASERGEPTFLTLEDSTLPAEFVQGIDLRTVRTPPNTVVLWPIRPTGLGDTVAFVVMGVNPHLGLDNELKSFLEIMQRQIATSAAAILLFEDEVRHREDVAKQLHIRTKELWKSELKFQRIADKAMVGIINLDLSGNIVYGNQAFREITGHTGEDFSMKYWLTLFTDDVAASLTDLWTRIHGTRGSVVAEFPLKKSWSKTLDSEETLTGSTWILLSAFVEDEDDGTIKGSLATITDISEQKWAEEHQKRQMEEAMELKRQQEAFVDMTSHEVRRKVNHGFRRDLEVLTGLM
jgi:PAS domain S-box-containing protein